MYLVNIDGVRPGQVLAKAVTNAKGATLCPPGMKLNETTIARLKNMGIDAVIVEGSSEGNASIRKRLDDLGERFKGVDDPLMTQIKAAAEKRLNLLLFQ